MGNLFVSIVLVPKLILASPEVDIWSSNHLLCQVTEAFRHILITALYHFTPTTTTHYPNTNDAGVTVTSKLNYVKYGF